MANNEQSLPFKCQRNYKDAEKPLRNGAIDRNFCFQPTRTRDHLCVKRLLSILLLIISGAPSAQDERYLNGDYRKLLTQKTAVDLMMLNRIRSRIVERGETLDLVDTMMQTQITYLLIEKDTWLNHPELSREVTAAVKGSAREWQRSAPSKYLNKGSIDFTESICNCSLSKRE